MCIFPRILWNQNKDSTWFLSTIVEMIPQGPGLLREIHAKIYARILQQCFCLADGLAEIQSEPVFENYFK